MFYNVYPVYYINVMLLDAKRSVILNTIDHILLQSNIFLLFFYFCKTRGMISAFSSYRYHNNYEIIMFMFICKQVFFQILSFTISLYCVINLKSSLLYDAHVSNINKFNLFSCIYDFPKFTSE